MFDKILLPLDISEASEVVIPYASELAGKFGSELILYYVRPPEREDIEHLFMDYLERLAETIKQNIKKTASNGVSVTIKIAVGTPEQSICELVNNNKIDLIIMASISSSGLKIGKTLGSVVDHICHTVPVPVMLIRPRRAQLTGKRLLFNNLLLPLDGSTLSKLALPVAEEVAGGLKIPVMLFKMADLPYPSETGSYLSGSEYVQVNERDEQVIESNYSAVNEAEESRMLAELITVEKELKENGITVDHRITSGIDAAKEIIQISKDLDSDLIVMSTHGRSGLNRWMMGSIAEKVLRYGEVPLLLINARAA
jgi:nucleotide-binding universal stress UspA family protein